MLLVSSRRRMNAIRRTVLGVDNF